MSNFRDIISKSILVLLFCLHAVNACRIDDVKNHFFSMTTDIQNNLLPGHSHFCGEHYELPEAQLDSIEHDFGCLLRHWVKMVAKSNQEMEAVEMDISSMRMELAHLKILQSMTTILAVTNANIRNIAEGTENVITAVEEKLQTMTTTLGGQTKIAFEPDDDQKKQGLFHVFSKIREHKRSNFHRAGKDQVELLVLEFNRIAKITELLESKEMETSCMRRKLAQESGHLKKATEENLLTMTTTLKEQEEKSKNLKADNENKSQTLGEKDAEISNLKNAKIALEHFLKNETAQSQTKLEAREAHISYMKTELAQRGKEIETMNTVLGVKDAKIRNVTEMSEGLKKQKFALDKNLQTMNTVLGVKDSNLKHSKLALEHFLKNQTTQRNMTLEAMKAEISRITPMLAEKEATIETMNKTLKERMTYVKTLAVIVVLMLLLYVFVMPCLLPPRFWKKEVRGGQSSAVLS